jgi:hypothetical protein
MGRYEERKHEDRLATQARKDLQKGILYCATGQSEYIGAAQQIKLGRGRARKRKYMGIERPRRRGNNGHGPRASYSEHTHSWQPS